MSVWQLMNTAPKDSGTRIDIWAKRWQAKDDEFVYRRFPDCYWVSTHFRNFDSGQWHATHWTCAPVPPVPEIITEKHVA